MILADKITNLRKKEGWSQEEFAERMVTWKGEEANDLS